jgi:hypothetical protein
LNGEKEKKTLQNKKIIDVKETLKERKRNMKMNQR